MKKSLALLWTVLVLTGLFVAGCHKNDATAPNETAPSGVTNEQEAMKYYAANDEFVRNDEETYGDSDVEPLDYGTFGKIDAAITPLRFGRFITSITKTVTVTVLPGDTIAVVFIEKTFVGTLKIKAKTGAGDTVVISKPFTDKTNRNVIFRRVSRDPVRFWFNWLPVASSLVDGNTVPPNNLIDITRLQFFLPNGDTITVSDPSRFYLRYRWLRLFTGGNNDVPELNAGDLIRMRVTLTSTSADTDVVALRYGFNLFQRRRQHMTLVSQTQNPDGSYTREYQTSWFVHFHRGYFHAGVDAMTRGTLFDDQAPYSVSWWGVPYRVL